MQRTYEKTVTTKRRGIAMMAALVFMTVFIAMAVGMMTMSSHNAIAASNLQTSNVARATAESGLELVRYWLSQVPASNGNVYADTIAGLEVILDDAEIVYDPVIDADGHRTLRIGPVPLPLNQAQSRSFEQTIADRMTEGIVNPLELIQINIENCDT